MAIVGSAGPSTVGLWVLVGGSTGPFGAIVLSGVGVGVLIGSPVTGISGMIDVGLRVAFGAAVGVLVSCVGALVTRLVGGIVSGTLVGKCIVGVGAAVC